MKKVRELLKNPLIYGSGIVLIGNFIANFFNLLFNIFMNKNLSVADYGTFLSVMSLIVFPGLVATAIIPVVVRFAGTYFAQNDFPRLRGLYFKIKKMLLLIGVGFFIIFLLAIPTIGNFFHINDRNILFMTDFIIFFGVIGVINMAFLQAKLAFAFQVFVNLLNAIIKLILSIAFVFAGFSVGGATMAMLIGGIAAYVVSFIPMKFIFDNKISSPSISTKELLLYGLPSSITLIGLTSFISSDILLVKHFFNPHDAGLYGGLSLLSRIIFFVTYPIATVMFPLIVQKQSKNENFTNTFKLSLLIVLVPSVLLTIFYAVFTKFSISILLKPEYFVISPYVVPFALFICCYAVLSIVCNFFLSIKKTRIFIPVISGALLQIFLIYLYHQTFLQVIYISLAITFVLVCLLLLYYPYATKRKI